MALTLGDVARVALLVLAMWVLALALGLSKDSLIIIIGLQVVGFLFKLAATAKQ